MTIFRKLFIVMAVFLALGIASCRNNSSGTEEPSVTNVPVKGISFDITGDTVDIPGGTTKKIEVVFDPPNATNQKYTLTAEKDGVVTIDEYGNVTAISHTHGDTTKITATSDDGNFTAECTVNVPVKKITSVTLPPIVYGDMFKGVQLTAKIEPEDASYKGVKWDSSDSSKINVDTLGNVRFYGNKFDEVTITATTDEGNHTATSRVIAIEAPTVDLIEDPNAGSLCENDVPANFVRIGPCAMPLGADASYKVTLTRGFEISDHEVTQKEFMDVMKPPKNYSFFDGTDGEGGGKKNGTINHVTKQYVVTTPNGETQENRPVENVTWFAAIAYCNKLSLQQKLTPCYEVEGVDWTNFKWGDLPGTDDARAKWYAAKCDFTANGYRLPTEAEWEIAARAGMGGDIWAGTSDVNEAIKYGWISANSGEKTHEVKMLDHNGWHLYDMTGNVSELCWDVWNSTTHPNGENPVGDPHISTSTDVVKMGGAWAFQQSNCSVSVRTNAGARYGNFYIGFRVVRTVK